MFTKFRSSITGLNAAVELPSRFVDWEVELVVAIGRAAHRVSEEAGWLLRRVRPYPGGARTRPGRGRRLQSPQL